VKPGDIVLTPLPQSDGMVKPRPAIVLDLLLPSTMRWLAALAPNFAIPCLASMSSYSRPMTIFARVD